jgi:deoxyadenosine/deoxycytidine kinase
MKKNVVVSGLIASGKTTLCDVIKEHFGETKINFVQENFGECEHLPLFYKDARAHVLDVETWFLDNRVANWQRVNSLLLEEEEEPVSTTKINLHDRCVYDSQVFAVANKAVNQFPEDKFLAYEQDFREKTSLLEKPDVILYLKVSAETCLQRIKARKRDMEKNITLEYLQAVANAYELYLEEMRAHCEVVVVPYEEFPPSTKTFVEKEIEHLFL